MCGQEQGDGGLAAPRLMLLALAGRGELGLVLVLEVVLGEEPELGQARGWRLVVGLSVCQLQA